MNKQLQSNLMLIMAAFIWGLAFVAQSVGMEHVGPWTFTCLRSWIAGCALACIIPLLQKNQPDEQNSRKDILVGGIWCGLFLAIASIFQQYGIQETTVGKAGFITCLYVVFVPIFSVLLKKKITINKWIAVVLSLIGLYFLSMNESFHIARGDFLILICAVLFAGHILVIDYFIQKANGMKMACVQFFVVGIVCLFPMLLLEKPEISQLIKASIPILYAGFFSSAIGYTLQILGQKNAEATVATLLLSLESVFSALAGYVLLHQRLSEREIIGCFFVFAAIILAQIDLKSIWKRESSTL